MAKLTSEQQEFLDRFLSTRAHAKGQIGGRQLAKIRGAYEEFCKRRQKVAAAIAKLESLVGGPPRAAEIHVGLQLVERQVDAASDLGDESVFPVANGRLAQLERDAQLRYDERVSQLRRVAVETRGLESDLQRVMQMADQDKRRAAAVQLRKTAADWIQAHHGADRQGVWEVYQAVVKLAGDAGKFGLALASQELEREAYELVRQFDLAKVDELADDERGWRDRVNDLNARIAEFIAQANQEGDGFHRRQLERTANVVGQLKSIVDPSPSSYSALPSSQISDDDDLLDDDLLDDERDGDVPNNENVSYDDELARRLPLEAKEMLDRVETEFARVESALNEMAATKQALTEQVSAAKSWLGDELWLLDKAVTDATDQLSDVTPLIESARSNYALVESAQNPDGEWETHLAALGEDVQAALRQLSTCERHLGRAEGGFAYVRQAFQSIESFSSRVEKLNAALMETVQNKLKVLAACDQVPTQGAELDMLKHLVLTADLSIDQLTLMLDSARDAVTLKELVRQLMQAPKLGTLAITDMMASCHQLVIDANRFFGDHIEAGATLDASLRKKFEASVELAKQDLAKYTVPVIAPQEGESTKGQQSVGVAIIGGGPIGLLAAIEARMGGASQVNVYEGRDDPYSRMNVLKIDPAPAQRLFAAGVGDALFPLGYNKHAPDEDPNCASVKTIEEALESRCKSLGVKLDRGLYLKDVRRNEQGKVMLFFKGQEDQPKLCDLLIVATGGSVASAQKNADHVVLSDVLGIPFQKSQVKDYAGVALFQRDTPTPEGNANVVQGWAYKFTTNEVRYLVDQLSEEEFVEFGKNPRGLIDKLREDAVIRKLVCPVEDAHPVRQSTASQDATVAAEQLDAEIDGAWESILQSIGPEKFHGSEKARDRDDKAVLKAKVGAKRSLEAKLVELRKQGAEEKLSPAEVEDVVLHAVVNVLGIARFPIEIQQAEQFASKDLSGVLVGDSAATPHPDTSKGLNTGINEMGAVKDLVQGLRRGQGTEQERQEKLRAYEFEVKRRTDFMVTEALNSLMLKARERIQNLFFKKFVPVMRDFVDADTRQLWYQSASGFLTSINIERDAAKDDGDWSKREDVIRRTRAFEAEMLAALTTIQQSIASGESTSEALMAPLQKILKDATEQPSL